MILQCKTTTHFLYSFSRSIALPRSIETSKYSREEDSSRLVRYPRDSILGIVCDLIMIIIIIIMVMDILITVVQDT